VATVAAASTGTSDAGGSAGPPATVSIDADAPPPGTVAPDTTAADGSTPTTDVADEEQDSVSPWWWVFGGVMAVAAVGGIAFGARRRNDGEVWARTASTTCDTGRALAASISEHLAEATAWSPPERIAHQRQRFTSYLLDSARTAPNAALAELSAAVATRNDELGGLLDSLAVGAPIDVARQTLGPSLIDLAKALTALENEAAIVVYGASIPSTRTTG
jgi:hypothetical protein